MHLQLCSACPARSARADRGRIGRAAHGTAIRVGDTQGADGTMTMRPTLEDLAPDAVGGDRDALDRLVRALQSDVYGLALRMLWNRDRFFEAYRVPGARTRARASTPASAAHLPSSRGTG